MTGDKVRLDQVLWGLEAWSPLGETGGLITAWAKIPSGNTVVPQRGGSCVKHYDDRNRVRLALQEIPAVLDLKANVKSKDGWLLVSGYLSEEDLLGAATTGARRCVTPKLSLSEHVNNNCWKRRARV